MALGYFIPGGGSLWTDKSTFLPSALPADQKLVSGEVNQLRDALYDVRNSMAAGTYLNINPVLVTATGSTTPRSTADRAADLVWLTDNGCKCDGVTDDYAALAALVIRLGSAHKTLVVPGPCNVSAPLTLPENLTVKFENNGHFFVTSFGVVKYSGFGVVSAGAMGATGSWAPWLFYSYRSNGAPGTDQYLNDVFGWVYNGDPANSSLPFSSAHCRWVEQRETHYGGFIQPLGFEMHWTYGSPDGLTSYRPMNFGVDYATSTASMNWNLGLYQICNRLNPSNPVFHLDTTIGSESFWFQPADNTKMVSFSHLGTITVAGNVVATGGVMASKLFVPTVVTLPYSANMVPEPDNGQIAQIFVTDANPFVIDKPAGALGTSRVFTLIIHNVSGGAIYASNPFVVNYRISAWSAINPGYRRAMTFVDTGNIIEISRADTG